MKLPPSNIEGAGILRVGALALVRVIALDLDGVVYEGSRLIPGAFKAIQCFSQLGYRVYAVTNNSARTRKEIQEKLNGYGISFTTSRILTSSFAAASFLKELWRGEPVLILGEEGLAEEITIAGIHVASEPPVQFLVVGLDRLFNYEKLRLGLHALVQGAQFLACNRDRSYPGENGTAEPGCGAMVAALEACSGRKVDFEVGKPNPYMLQLIQECEQCQPCEILVIGDSAESDIAMAQAFGSPSILINRPGFSSQRTTAIQMNLTIPNWVLDSLAAVPTFLEAARCSKSTPVQEGRKP